MPNKRLDRWSVRNSRLERLGLVPSGGDVLIDWGSGLLDSLPTTTDMTLAQAITLFGDSDGMGDNNTWACLEILPDGGQQVVRWNSPANTHGTGTNIGVGVNSEGLFEGLTVDKAYIEYDIRFDAGFGWGWGGKLPGLAGCSPGFEPPPSGGDGPDGHKWAGRFMWLEPPAGGDEAHELVSYEYRPDYSGGFGQNVHTSGKFVAGVWTHVEHWYEMNSIGASIGNSDGLGRVIQDDVVVSNRTNVRYRDFDTCHINHMQISLFRGGDAAWRSTIASSVSMKNLRVVAYG